MSAMCVDSFMSLRDIEDANTCLALPVIVSPTVVTIVIIINVVFASIKLLHSPLVYMIFEPKTCSIFEIHFLTCRDLTMPDFGHA